MSPSGTSPKPASTAPAQDGHAERLRVTLIGTLPPIKGVSPYTSHLLKALADDPGLEIEFVGFRSIYPRWLYPGGDPIDRSQPSPQYPGASIRNILAWYDPLSWIRAGLTLRGEVVHAQWWSYILAPVYATVLAIAKLRGKRTLLTLHNVYPHERAWWKRALHRAVFFLGDRFIVHSEDNRESLGRVYRSAANTTSVIRHGILTLTSREGVSTTDARRRLGIPARDRTMLYFGNIRPYKGLNDLLRALPEVLAACPSTTLVIAGKPWTNWQPLGRLIDDLGVRSRVRLFLDFVPAAEVEPFFAAADVVVLPYTQFDAQSGVGALALSFRKPLVVSAVGGLADLVLDPRVAVPPWDASALAAAIIEVLTDENLRRKLETDADEVAARFGWQPIAAQTIDLYRSLVRVPDLERATEVATTRNPSRR
jgi:glycosyltransferase involved in cell wall biosynthesis